MTRKTKRILTVVLAIAIVFVFSKIPCGCWKQKKNVIFIMTDTLRADHMGVYGYERNTSPVMDQFARENTMMSYTVSSAPWTPVSIATMFTGLSPSTHGMMPPNDRNDAVKLHNRLNSDFLTMAELFKQNEYQTAAVMNNPWIKEDFGFLQGFDWSVYKERKDADSITGAARKYLSDIKDPEKPFFLYLHFMDPHNPFKPRAPFNEKFQGELESRKYEEKYLNYLNLYDGEINFLDAELGKFFNFLKEKDLYEDTIIVFISDHGEQFMEHGHSGHGFNLYNEELHVPFFIKHDGKPRVIEEMTGVIDLYPTLFDVAGIEVPQKVQGYSLISQLEERAKKPVISEVKRVLNSKSITTHKEEKLILNYQIDTPLIIEKTTPSESKELYNIQIDYSEAQPLKNPELEGTLKKLFDYHYQDRLNLKSKNQTEAVEIDAGTVEELESLGYF